jgi:polyphosphate kinase 2 (PPK2 family)/uncharacterized membrane protein YgcG
VGRLDEVDLGLQLGREEEARRLKECGERLAQLRLTMAGLIGEERLGPPLIVVFEGWDASGKGGAIKRLVAPLDPRHVRVAQFAAPTPDEKRHHFLGRFWPALPGWGGMTVFDRSWYGRVLVERVEGFASEEEWRRAYAEIVAFERSLADEGAILVKVWLHLSPEEQLKRFEARAADPLKSWKLTAEDWRNREKRPQYEAVVEEMLAETDRPGRSSRPSRSATPGCARWSSSSRRWKRACDAQGRNPRRLPRIPPVPFDPTTRSPIPLSRLRIIALLAALLALAITMTACGGGGSDSSDEDPNEVLEQATFEGVESGHVRFHLGMDANGEQSTEVGLRFAGPFRQATGQDLPEFQVHATLGGSGKEVEGLDVKTGLTLLSDRAFVAYKGVEYEVDPTTFSFVKSAVEQAQQESGAETGDSTGCQKALEEIEFAQLLENPKNDGTVDVEGTPTTKVSGHLEVSGGIDVLTKLIEDPACAKQLEAAGPLPTGELDAAKKELSSALKEVKLELFVGDDNIIRKVVWEFVIEPKGANETVLLYGELVLSEVNEQQTITPPSNAQPIEQLFKKLDINPLELMEAGSSGGLGGLLEGATGSLGSGGGGGSSSGGGSASQQQAYVECLQTAESAADIQNCSSLLQ